MKIKFEKVYGTVITVLVIVVLWNAWAVAQTNTNQVAAVSNTNAPSGLFRMEQVDQHFLTFGLDRVEFLRTIHPLGEPLWKYIASLIYIFLAFYVAKILDLITNVWLKKWAARTQTQFDDLLLELLRGPVKVVAFVILLHIGLNVFAWPPLAQTVFSKGLILIVAGSLTYLAIKIIDLLLDFWRRRSAHEGDHKFNDQLFSVLRKSLNVFVIVVAVLVTAQNMGINITAVITSLSIGGLAVGLAAQDTLANLFGAVAVFADKPFQVGDQIKLDQAEGQVESVGLRSTRLRNPEGHLITVPNKTMGNAAITNMTRRTAIKTTLNFVLPRELPSEKVKRAVKLLEEIYRANPMTQDVLVSFNQFSGRNLNLQVVHWWKGTDNPKYMAGMQEMNLAVKDRFDAEGITLL